MQIILGRQIYCWTWGFAHLALCLTLGCIQVSTGSGGCVPTDVLQSAATFLPPSPLAASAPWSPATATSSSARVQVGFNLWWQQLYWAMNTMNSPAPTHLLLHRGTSDQQIHRLFPYLFRNLKPTFENVTQPNIDRFLIFALFWS